MIFYVCHSRHAYTQATMLLYFRTDLQAVFRLVPYEDKALLGALSRGTVIWTDMDRLTVADIETASALSRTMRQEQPDVVQLNHPRESLQRFDLLRKLAADGVNDFRVYRPGALPDDLRFPVFLRDEMGAAYATPRLLQDHSELDSALAGLAGMGFVRPMIVEFGSKPGSDGYYRKYSAYRIGGRSYAQHCFAKQEWFIKDPGRGIPPQHIEEHRAYVRDHPHKLSLMPIFDKASITYGRIDYTVVDGRIQVFEINTNPTVLSYPPTPFDAYDSTPYASMHADALLALPHALDLTCPPGIEVSHSRILAGLRRDYGKRRRKLFVRKGLRFVRSAVLGEKA